MSNKRRASKAHNNNVYHLEQALLANGRAYHEGPKRKSWSQHDLKNIKPLTPAQRDMFHDFMTGQNIYAHGSAGTGKTFVAIYLALHEVLNPETPTNKIIIVRSAVQTREIGHTPGTVEEKAAVYELPYKSMFAEIMGRHSTYQDMKEAGLVEFNTTSFIRGITWESAVVIVDEGQNMDFHEIDSIMTRLGDNSRMLFVGDLRQTDLRHKGEKTGMDKFMRIANRMNEFSNVEFTKHDIVRSKFVKSWITASEEELG